jgi:hypothetical protein
VVNARQLVYYICKQRMISGVTMKRLMEENSFSVNNSTISHGIKKCEEMVEQDSDYYNVSCRINKKITI